MATANSHMACNRKNAQSTAKLQQTSEQEEEEDFFPQQEPNKTHDVFFMLKLAEEFGNIIYMDLAGKFPTTAQSEKSMS